MMGGMSCDGEGVGIGDWSSDTLTAPFSYGVLLSTDYAAALEKIAALEHHRLLTNL